MQAERRNMLSGSEDLILYSLPHSSTQYYALRIIVGNLILYNRAGAQKNKTKTNIDLYIVYILHLQSTWCICI